MTEKPDFRPSRDLRRDLDYYRQRAADPGEPLDHRRQYAAMADEIEAALACPQDESLF